MMPKDSTGASARVVTVVNGVGPTSMPVNEFHAFRKERHLDKANILIALSKPENALDGNRSSKQLLTLTAIRDFLQAILRASAPSEEDTVIHFHHPRSAVLGLLTLLATGRLKSTYTVFTVHSMFPNYTRFTKGLSTFCAYLAHHVTFVSDAAEQSFPKWPRKNKSTVIRNGVDLDRITLVTSKSSQHPNARPPNTALRLVSVARHVPVKNQPFLLQVVSRTPSIELTMVGDGPLRGDLEALAASLGISDRVHFVGLLEREQVYEEVRKSDVFVTSSFYEGLPVALLEALALGKVVVASDIPPHRQVLEPHKGRILLPLDIGDWVRELELLDRTGRRLITESADSNSRYVQEHFALIDMHIQYSRLYSRGIRI